MSKKIKINFKKQLTQFQVTGVTDLKNKIYEVFRIPPAKLRFVKPKIQNDMDIKEGAEIMIMGVPEEKTIKEDPEMKYLATLNEDQKNYYLQKKQGIIQHPFKNDQEIGAVTYISSSLHLLRIIPEFRKFLKTPQFQQESLKLYVEDLDEVFSEIEDEKIDVVSISPIDIVSSFVSYADQVGEFPYQTHDPIWFFHYTFKLLEQGDHVIKNYNPKQQYNWIKSHFITKYNTLNNDIQKCQQVDDPLQINYSSVLERWWMVAKIDSKIIRDQKTALNYYKDIKTKERRIDYAFEVIYQQQIKTITELPPFILVYMDRMVYKPNVKKIKDPHVNQELMKQYIKQHTHEVTYYKTIDFYDECNSDIQNQLLEARKRRDLQFNSIKQTKEFKEWIKKLPNAKELTETQQLYAYKESVMNNQEYAKFYGQQYTEKQGYKNRTGQYTLIGVLTHKGEKQDANSYCTAYVQKFNNKWLKFNNNNIESVTLNDVLSFKGNQKNDRKDEFAHILIYRCIQWL